MYLARTTVKNGTRYFIRDTYRDGDVFKSRDLFDLGNDPARYIIYPGGKGYYFDEQVLDVLSSLGVKTTQDELDPIFWDFLDPEIKRAINGFQHKKKQDSTPASKTNKPVHLFDKRRAHYLRFAQMNQGDVSNLPAKLFKHLHDKSRDEIEQYFLREERILRPRELKRYIFAIFNMEHVVRKACAEGRHEDLSQAGMDTYFTGAVCSLNDDTAFWAGLSEASRLRGYLKRYVIMYFDHAFPTDRQSHDYVNDFINRHRRYTPPRKVQESIEETCRLFETDWKVLKGLDRNDFSRLYRKQALKHHPDQGGSEKTFVRLTRLYRHLLKKKKRTHP